MTYQVDKFGNDRDGYCFYEECDYIRASEVCFFEKQFIKAYFCDIHHCTSTLSGKAESYNELHKFSKASLFYQVQFRVGAVVLGNLEADDPRVDSRLDLASCTV